ncbi:MAG TPA: DUF6691 family protein [Polyangiaceae bacterium]|jgi:hypothetical protein|nr:DUF6691 family protein [Polyangiaceae bacterium]
MTLKTGGFGVLFGFVLSRVGATDYDAIAGMFRLEKLHLAGVMATAIGMLAFAFWSIRRRSARTLSGKPIALTPKPMTKGLVAGALLFGVGWALSGTCPGTALAQLGEGKLAALATVAGILFSSALVEAWQARSTAPPGFTQKAAPEARAASYPFGALASESRDPR